MLKSKLLSDVQQLQQTLDTSPNPAALFFKQTRFYDLDLVVGEDNIQYFPKGTFFKGFGA
jgi:hypothetical protein